MSFYKEEIKGDKLIISDESIDILMDAFQEIEKIYNEGPHRLPNINELEIMLKNALEMQSDSFSLEEQEVVDCKFKLKKRRKKSFKPGIVFAINLKNINKYGYGMLVKGQNVTRPYDGETYIEYFSLFIDEKIRISEFKNYYKNQKEVLFTAYTAWSGWLDGDWKIIGGLPMELFDPGEYNLPDFVFENKDQGTYFVSRGRADGPLIDFEMVSEEEGKKIKNPSGIAGQYVIEDWLEEKYSIL
ncbi:immunity 26/phosphotriesterase HocA family protein [Bacillus thuringiensis]|uniref:Immunity protein 26 of polymorphic toxin system n=1 Tax=Bacillus thuringiensis TaxID=1428 RepID=A0A9X6Q224_BACTU|nr:MULTISPECIES: Imm26 family immunity protein [Bacillus cereus group]MDA2610931.1 Imm26 family immunity protein [Bacillus cereus]MEB8552648.1 Imm26 family immunity protein [Bacillus cereus]MEB8724124.1 Imm26 family immunity protein [Bacillus cereus]MEB8819708.1 Imm26 family immunity protein [Bacillus cereus]MEB8974778.1 Imm26 family immunity protein [Bacillus cereus]